MESTNQPVVFLFTDWYLPGYKAGGPISSCTNLISALGDSVRFKVVCGDRDYLDEEPYPDVVLNKWITTGRADVMYISATKRKYSVIKKLLSDNKPDHVYINGLFSRVFSIFPLLAATKLQLKTIIAPRGMLAPGALGLKSRKKQAFLNLGKSFGVYRKSVFHATHAHEAAHILENIHSDCKIVELANIPKIVFPAARSREKKANVLRMVSVARIAREKNIDFALNCLKGIPGHIQIHFTLIGPVYDAGYSEQCRSIALPENVTLEWAGPKTPIETGKLVGDSDLFFLPTLGENYGHAILEALLCGIPVLISDQTPWTSLSANGLGLDLPLGDTAPYRKFIEKVAEMDTAAYALAFGSVAERAAKLVDLPELIAGYKTLFE